MVRSVQVVGMEEDEETEIKLEQQFSHGLM